ncbi:COP9 signalosome complex subunit 7 [Geosmithia morbida]|uniref:COP9 signalosome complex subunit 7 n=1 Tax=Geosmithia morbida TaxID=1094350 RepID=A0A9P5D2L9_9HYPO|nr:COP9 signalosome complex subunit 7 [Geosmithia morbida]KAF4125223.1 COP9 signalosome complex subunit 7 [Geosmithia morbida]
MEQTKALNALEPFLILSKSATSPRAAVDLVRQATSAPNTFIFAELLQTPPVASLASSTEADHRSHHALLRIFSHGTYADYIAGRDGGDGGDGLPELSDTQALKLRQLSVLSLARDRDNLSYASLQEKLGLSSARQVEDLVVTAVYAGLVSATLDPARQAVQVTGVAPLRDLAPGAVPYMVRALGVWSARCESTLQDLDGQIAAIKADARARKAEKRKADDRFARAKADAYQAESSGRLDVAAAKRDMMNNSRKWAARRAQQVQTASGEVMDLDDPISAEGRGNKRKM